MKSTENTESEVGRCINVASKGQSDSTTNNYKTVKNGVATERSCTLVSSDSYSETTPLRPPHQSGNYALGWSLNNQIVFNSSCLI